MRPAHLYKLCLLNHMNTSIFTCFSSFCFLPPSWGSPHHVQQWLEVRAQTIHRISPEGCAMSWQKRRWQSQSSGPKSARCHSTSSHLPVDRTAPYLRQEDIRVVLKMWLSTRGSWPKQNRKMVPLLVIKVCLSVRCTAFVISGPTFWDHSVSELLSSSKIYLHMWTCDITCHAWDEVSHRLLLTEAVTAVITTGPKLSKLHKQNTHTHTRETTQAQKRTHTQPWAAFAILGTRYMVVCLITV